MPKTNPNRIRPTTDDKKWAKAVKTRDAWACIICKSLTQPNAHHLIPKEIKEFRHDISNGVTLCPKHHRFSRQISAHQNPIAFIKWLEAHRPAELEWAKSKCQIFEI